MSLQAKDLKAGDRLIAKPCQWDEHGTRYITAGKEYVVKGMGYFRPCYVHIFCDNARMIGWYPDNIPLAFDRAEPIFNNYTE